MSQRTLFDWTEEGGESEPGRPRRRTIGAIDLAALSDGSDRRVVRAHELHWQLECHLGVVDMVVTDNRRRMLTVKSDGGRYRIRLHHMFLSCDPETVAAIAGMAKGEEDARGRIQRYVRCNRDEISFRPDDAELEAAGEHFDLSEILGLVRSLLPEDARGGTRDVAVSWGRDARGTKSIRFGSFDFDQRLIRVHPALDEPWVPRYFVGFIVYHELLHAVCPPVEGPEERDVHTDEFDELERQFPKYEEAVRWESENLDRFLDRNE